MISRLLYKVRKNHKMAHIVEGPITTEVEGQDHFGDFTLSSYYCFVCKDAAIVVEYQTINLGRIEINNTILRDIKNAIGITCGCYGKFHRQVAHINDYYVEA